MKIARVRPAQHGPELRRDALFRWVRSQQVEQRLVMLQLATASRDVIEDVLDLAIKQHAEEDVCQQGEQQEETANFWRNQTADQCDKNHQRDHRQDAGKPLHPRMPM